MIVLYSGTPGSGKSLHMAKNIYKLLKKTNCLVICNFYIKFDSFTEEEKERFVYLDNSEITPDRLIKIAIEYWKTHKAKNYHDAEQRIRLFIDEAQILFNARDWQVNQRKKWPWFFSVHRHYGFHITLCSQMDTNLDKQVRGVIEYNNIHRKVANIGLAGAIINFFSFGGLFYSVLRWYPMQQKIDGAFFKYKKKYGDLYDTHALFSDESDQQSIITFDGDKESTAEGGALLVSAERSK